MPRVAWSLLLILLFALPLASCFDQESCSTCPAPASARIGVRLPLGSARDSLHVWLVGGVDDERLDAGDSITIRRGGSLTYTKLLPGVYTLTASRWYLKDFVVFVKTASVQVKVEAGEYRVVTFQNDFPIVTDATIQRRAPLPLAGGPSRLRVG